jgi:DMSO/TMAO reductase YedYZ molybdopterin-dependent catalytic subunit
VLLATGLDGAPLPPARGGPLRLIVPERYAWKSVKWLRRLDFLPQDEPGYWERRGAHPAADPWRGERML